MPISFVFFGNSPFSKIVADELRASGFIQRLTIDDARATLYADNLKQQAPQSGWDLFVVASFGKIISADILALPKHGSLNVHPSLLPKYRGPSPIQSAILGDDRDTGVSIMRMDDRVDHGPIIAQKHVPIPAWPPTYDTLENILGHAGGKLLAATMSDWCAGKISANTQDDTAATLTKKITLNDGRIDFDPTTKNFRGDAYQNFLKIQAFSRWPRAHFFIERHGRQRRVVITQATYENNTLVIERVIPEGKQEMNWRDFVKGYL